jgi:hypothetical protein
MEELQVYAVGYHGIAEVGKGAQRLLPQAVRERDYPVGPTPDPSSERSQETMNQLESTIVGVIAGNVGAPERHYNRRSTQIE